MDFVDALRREGAVIAQAPVSFVICVLIASVLLYWLLRAHFSGQMDTLNSRLALKDDQLQDYREKLSGRSPDEAKSRLDTLEQELKSLRPRRLSDQQRAALIAAATKARGTIEIVSDVAASDVRGYVSDLSAALQAAGWEIRTGMVMGIGNPPPTGVGLIVADPANLTRSQRAIAEALNQAGIEFDVQRGGRGPVRDRSDAEIVVTTKA